jgi:hypothetical protein
MGSLGVVIVMSVIISSLGFFLHMDGAPTSHVLPMMAVGTLLLAVRFPTARRFAAAFERAAGAKFADSVVPG